MQIGRLAAWEAIAEEPLVTTLTRMFPHKLPRPIQTAAARILSATSAAWVCYEAGGRAAAFDILNLITEAELPMPMELSDELSFLASLAMGGQVESLGRGKRSPLEEHRAAMLKRFRYEHIISVMADAEMDAHEDDPTNGVWVRSKLPPEEIARIRSERSEVYSGTMKAIGIARQRMPNLAGAKRAGTPEAYYQDFMEVAAAAATDTWPGSYYLPSQTTCTFLGWDELQQGFLELGIATDAPRLRVG